MQRKYSEPNAYIDSLPRGRAQQEELYDDVDLPDPPVVRCCGELCGDRGRTSGRGESPAVRGESFFPKAAKRIPSLWGEPGFCNGTEASAGEESTARERGFQWGAAAILRQLG